VPALMVMTPGALVPLIQACSVVAHGEAPG
jgi:hypothetical protein